MIIYPSQNLEIGAYYRVIGIRPGYQYGNGPPRPLDRDVKSGEVFKCGEDPHDLNPHARGNYQFWVIYAPDSDSPWRYKNYHITAVEQATYDEWVIASVLAT